MFKSITLVLLLLTATMAYGDVGSTCDPSTASWATCTKVSEPSWASSVTNNQTIAGGYYATPYQATQSYARYTLSGNITANATAIENHASYVIFDLNGYTITYNEENAGSGIRMSMGWGQHHVMVHNGSIIQGTDECEGNKFGLGCNPIAETPTHEIDSGDCDRTEIHAGNATCVEFASATYDHTVQPVSYAQLANLHIKYAGKDVRGVVVSGYNAIIEQCTIEDDYGPYGTIKVRDSGIVALGVATSGGGSNSVIRNNTLKNIRHIGITHSSTSHIYNNDVNIRSIDTNSLGIGGGSAVYNNRIYGRGVHPIGMYYGWNSKNADIYNNTIDIKTTALGREYGAAWLSNKSGTYTSLNGVGFRSHFGATNIGFHDNNITIHGGANETAYWAITGETAYINSEARGINVGLYEYDNESLDVYNNIVNATSANEGGNVSALTVTGNSAKSGDHLVISNNLFISNAALLRIGSMYGPSYGYPLIYGNTFQRTGSLSSFVTVANDSNGYYAATARLVDNTFTGGATLADAKLFPNDSNSELDIYFGTKSGDDWLYSYRLHDGNNTSSSSTPLREDFDPAITLAYFHPGDVEVPADPEDPVDPTGPADPPGPTPTTSGPILRTGSSLLRVGDGVLRVQ
jgi:hypothetical protein